MPHALTGAFEKAGGIGEEGAMEEADAGVRAIGADVAERRLSHARRGLIVMHKLTNVGAAAAHVLEPGLDDPSQLVIGRGEPGVDGRVSLNLARKG